MAAISRALTGSLLLNLLSIPAFAAPGADLPGGVSLRPGQQAAVDLVYEGKPLQPDEARALGLDLSTLNPIDDSVLWRDDYPKTDLPVDAAELGLNLNEDEVEFIDADAAPSGRVIFIGQKKRPNGEVRTYRFLLDDKGHNLLLRKTLLRKIGYRVPAMARQARLRVKFSGAFSKREFINEHIKKRIFKDPNRWLVSDPQSDDEYLSFQDLIVLKNATDWYYNLAYGNMAEGVVQGRRLFNSLLVPYTLTDAPESLNLMSWTGVDIFNDQVIFPYEYRDLFKPSLDDARWMARRIMRLTEKDWTEIVRSADLPPEPAALLLEILKSRRNTLRDALKLEAAYADLPADLNVSLGDRLKEGKLVGGRKWEGYGRQFAGEDPESPLSLAEKVGLMKSVALSNAISNGITEFNLRFMPGTDLGYKIFDHQLDVSAQQLGEFIRTGKVSETPFGFWKTPFSNVDVITARALVTGSYMGAENNMQLADTIGLSADAGLFFLGEGLPVKMTASARAKIRALLTYTHLKPIKSIRASLKEPLSNILVPYLKYKSTDPLRAIMDMESKVRRGEYTKEMFDEEIKSHFEEFEKSFGPGESYIISFLAGPGAELSVGKGIAEDLQAYVKFKSEMSAVSRVHIYRKDKHTVHVYIDPTLINEYSAYFGLRAKIPILELGYDRKDGTGWTNYFSFNIDPNLEMNPRFFDNVTAVAAALMGAPASFLTSLQNPWRLAHSFGDGRFNFNLLMFKNVKADTSNRIRAIDPEGNEARYARRTRGQRGGIEYQGVILDVANAIIAEKHQGTNLRLSVTQSGNPGDTIYGKSVLRQATAEARFAPGAIDLDNVFTAVNYRWKGWEIGRKGLEAIFDDIERMFGRKLFEKPSLNTTTRAQLYSVDVQVALYKRAIEHLLEISEDRVEELFKLYGRELVAGDEYGRPHPWAQWLTGDLKDMRRALHRNDYQRFIDELSAVMETAETQLEFEGFKELVGGIDNLFIQGVLRGFRVNAENGQEDVRPISLGRIGAFEPRGPIAVLQSNTGISNGELLLHWLVNPL